MQNARQRHPELAWSTAKPRWRIVEGGACSKSVSRACSLLFNAAALTSFTSLVAPLSGAFWNDNWSEISRPTILLALGKFAKLDCAFLGRTRPPPAVDCQLTTLAEAELAAKATKQQSTRSVRDSGENLVVCVVISILTTEFHYLDRRFHWGRLAVFQCFP